MATVRLPDGQTINMRVPMRGSEIAAIDEADNAEFVRKMAILYRVLYGAALDDASRRVVEELPAPDLAGLLEAWSGATEDDALPPANGSDSATP